MDILGNSRPKNAFQKEKVTPTLFSHHYYSSTSRRRHGPQHSTKGFGARLGLTRLETLLAFTCKRRIYIYIYKYTNIGHASAAHNDRTAEDQRLGPQNPTR